MIRVLMLLRNQTKAHPGIKPDNLNSETPSQSRREPDEGRRPTLPNIKAYQIAR